MIKKEGNPSRSVHRIDLPLPVVQSDSYEIFYTSQPFKNQVATNLRALSRQKPPIDNNNNNIKKNVNHSARIRSPARFKHLIGPVSVDLFVDMGSMTAESISTMGETVSNPLINPSRTLKGFPAMIKRPKRHIIKDDGDRSRSSSDERLLYESLGSFDDQNINKSKNNMWQNIHHPQLTSTKALHSRGALKRTNDTQLKASNTASLDNLSQESVLSTNERLYVRIEELTKNYFPAIRQIRHSRPSPELMNNRMRLHREENKIFMPVLSRTRFVP